MQHTTPPTDLDGPDRPNHSILQNPELVLSPGNQFSPVSIRGGV
jgi:hypothetical protein